MKLKKNFNIQEGITMIEHVLESHSEKLPEGKTINDFGGGYVECLKSKANVVLYFGFDSSKNRVSKKFQINRDEVLLWQEAISEKLWNKEKNNDEIISFGNIKTSTNKDEELEKDNFFKGSDDSPFQDS